MNKVTPTELNEKCSELVEVLSLIQSSTPNSGSLRVDDIEDQQIQTLLEKVIQLYVAKARARLDHQDPESTYMKPLVEDHHLTQTETVFLVDQLLQLLEIEIFEVQMWRSMS